MAKNPMITAVKYDESYLWKLVEGAGRQLGLVWDPPDVADCSAGGRTGEDWYCYYCTARPQWRSSTLGPDDLGKLPRVVSVVGPWQVLMGQN